MTDALWYAGRGTGVVSLLLLTIVVALGVAARSGRPLLGLARFAVSAVHRTASLTAVILLGVHVTTLLLDPVAQLRLVDLVVPFQGAYRPMWLGLGTVGFDLLGALVISSLLRARIGVRAWRAIHWAAYAAWPVALFHSLGTGTDAATGWFQSLAVGSVATVLAAVAWRLSPGFTGAGSPGRRAVPAPFAAPDTRRLAAGRGAR